MRGDASACEADLAPGEAASADATKDQVERHDEPNEEGKTGGEMKEPTQAKARKTRKGQAMSARQQTETKEERLARQQAKRETQQTQASQQEATAETGESNAAAPPPPAAKGGGETGPGKPKG